MSFAIMTRTHWLEGPYLNEFIAWYKHWGFSKIYFINTEPAKKKALLSYIDQELLASVVIIDHSGNINTFPYARKLFTSMTEDYVLHVDTDELLVLPNGYNNIADFVKTNNFDLYTFHWVLVPVNKFIQPSMLDYLHAPHTTFKPGDARKMMVRRKAWLNDPRSKISMHYMSCKGTSVDYNKHVKTLHVDGSEPFVLHFSVRGYLHTLFKIKHQRLAKSSTGNLQQFLGGSAYPNCPTRFRIAIADIYSSKQPVDTKKWNVNCNLSYKKCTTQDLLKLYGSLEDTHNLTKKVQDGINLLNLHNVPVNIHSGGRYNNFCLRALQR